MTREPETQRQQYQRIRRALGWTIGAAARVLGVHELEMARLERSEEFGDCYRLARFYTEHLKHIDHVPLEPI